jgi:RNA polymerase sigma-70 factor (ECF subfamily)
LRRSAALPPPVPRAGAILAPGRAQEITMDTSPGASANVFHNQLEANLPRLRRHGLALTRNRHAMEDLVQETVMRALAAEASFEPGTNFGGWINMILRNQFISNVRRARTLVPLGDAVDEFFAVASQHDERFILHELTAAIDRLPRGQRDALLLSALSDLSYAQIAAVLACRTGTVKSRVSRSRSRLRDELIGVAAGDKNGAA